MYTYNATLIKVISGDTIDAEIDLGFGVYVKQRIRLFGILATDVKSQADDAKETAIASRDFLSHQLKSQFIVETIMNKRGKIGRILGTVFTDNGTNLTNINELMVEKGHAIEYKIGSN